MKIIRNIFFSILIIPFYTCSENIIIRPAARDDFEQMINLNKKVSLDLKEDEKYFLETIQHINFMNQWVLNVWV